MDIRGRVLVAGTFETVVEPVGLGCMGMARGVVDDAGDPAATALRGRLEAPLLAFEAE